jgi:hypothetical protein
MLNEYLPDDLFKEELLKRDWLFNNMDKDEKWKGGKLIVPFKAAGASSIKFGSMTGSTDIAEDKYVRGSVDDYQELWGTMIFNHRDLMDHSGRVKEDSFIKILPDQVDDFMDYMKMAASINTMCGPHFATLTVDGTAGGVAEIDRVDRFSLNQKVTLIDGDTAQADYYVIAIDVNGGTLKKGSITLSATRGGASVSIAAYTVAQSAKFYHDGVLVTGVATNKFTSLKSGLLSLANGGASSLHGVTKLSAPYLQAINIDGSTINASNILEKLFLGYVEVRKKAKGKANKVVMSFKHLGACMAAIENQKGAFKVSVQSTKASEYGWTEIEVFSVTGEALTLVGIQEMDDDVIMYLDMSAFKFHSNGFFKKRTAPDGKQYFEVRNTNGYQYILDIALFGDFVLKKPGNCGIIFGIVDYNQ